MRCPFCPGLLEGDVSDLGEGETGGAASIWHLGCSGCGAKLRRLRVDKVLEATEEWAIERAPTTSATPPQWQCPQCAGPVRGAIPPDAEVEAPWSTGDHASRLTLRGDAVCSGCSARYERVATKEFDSGSTIVSSDESWYAMEREGNRTTARPIAPLKAISGA